VLRVRVRREEGRMVVVGGMICHKNSIPQTPWVPILVIVPLRQRFTRPGVVVVVVVGRGKEEEEGGGRGA